MKKGLMHIIAVCLIGLLGGILLYKIYFQSGQDVPAVILGSKIEEIKEPDWTDTAVIAHAGGMVDGKAYTNCKDAVLQNYEKGFRVFELDLIVTSDQKIVARHGWDSAKASEMQEGVEINQVLDEETFLNIPIYGKYTPLSFESICYLMDEYPDIWIVTDTKYTEEPVAREQFRIMIDTAKEIGMEHVLDRLTVQIYNEEMYDVIYEVYPFDKWIYTLYKFWQGDVETFEECAKFAIEKNISAITMWNYLVSVEVMDVAHEYGIPVYAHTENNIENARVFMSLGLKGLYTDSITPEMIQSVME